jgi:hypothetical protein
MGSLCKKRHAFYNQYANPSLLITVTSAELVVGAQFHFGIEPFPLRPSSDAVARTDHGSVEFRVANLRKGSSG